MLAMAPTAPSGPDAPAEAFSAARAMTHISAIADDPRPVGSAQHGEARAYLLNQLGSLGWRTEVQQSIGMFDFGVDGTQPIAAVANVIATKPGTASTGTVLLTAHYDTVAGSPGAGDDGIGVGVLLETARALSTADAPRNTVMILLTDAEEVGLLGAEAFVRERAKELGTAVVLNHEARGAGGAPLTFRMSSPNSELLEVLAGAPGAFADSSSEASFEALPNDTDFTPFEQAGLYGYDTGIMADGAYYHSPLDDPAHLSAASLQQMGDTTLALTRELAGMDLAAIGRGGEEIVTSLPWGLLRYPQSLEIPLAIGVLVLAAVLVWLLRRRGALTLPRVALSAAASVVMLVAAGAASYAVWRLALLIDPAQASAVVGEPYRPVLYRLAMLLAVWPSSSRCSRWYVDGWVPSASPSACSSCSPSPACFLRSPCPASPVPWCSRRWSWLPVRSSRRCFLSVVRSPVPVSTCLLWPQRRPCSGPLSGSDSTSGSMRGRSVWCCSPCSCCWRFL